MAFKPIIGAVSICLTITSINSNAALISRLDGLAFYDDQLDITWVANGGQNSRNIASKR